MDRDIKFEYGFQSVNGIVKKVYHLHEIPYIKEICDVWNVSPIVYVRRFTGLKDKKGTDIYENDLLSNGKYIFEVQFNVQQGKWCLNPIKCLEKGKEEWFLTAIEYSQLGNGYYSRKDLEKIGTIHENPDLIP